MPQAPRRRSPRKGSADGALAESWKAVWGTVEGRRAIGELLVALNLYSPIETTDPIQLAIAEGERRVACRIARYIGLRPDAFVVDGPEIVGDLERMINHYDQ